MKEKGFCQLFGAASKYRISKQYKKNQKIGSEPEKLVIFSGS